MSGLKSFRATLQQEILPTDENWTYLVPNLPSSGKLDEAGATKSISFVSSKEEQYAELKIETLTSNRITRFYKAHLFLALNVANFRLRMPKESEDQEITFAPWRESAGYLAGLLKTGISLNNVHYSFFGHSNSQLKSRSCLLFAATKPEISVMVEALGDFSKMKSVAKKVKRIGLLFSTAEVAVQLDPDRCEDIDDVVFQDYTFTDGCGLISEQLARTVVQRRNIVFRNKRYLPSVFQIRYKGYKGVLTLAPSLKGQFQVQFRQSMKKFTTATDNSFSVVECSKPYSFGYLNDEVILLLHSLGISAEMLHRKQAEYLHFLDQVSGGDPRAAFRFLSYQSEIGLAEKLLIDGVESVMPSLQKMVGQERAKMLSKRDVQRCRIMIPNSRLLFGVCDPFSTGDARGRLKPGTCFVRITDDATGEARTIINTEVMVTRNPCLHPGDLQKFRVVDIPGFSHLVDCIVFPVCGKRPSADLMSGGDLDGDKFFVTWDPDIIPTQIAESAEYPGVRERIHFGLITDDERAEFFAGYTSASLGRVKNLYLDWARLRGPMSDECQQLNRLFSQCVDGNRIRIPPELEKLPKPAAEVATFILDELHAAATDSLHTTPARHFESIDSSEDLMDILANRDHFALSEFELIKLVLRRCDRLLEDSGPYSPLFNYAALSDEEKAWLLGRVPSKTIKPNLVLNGLLQSDLVMPAELEQFGLDHSALHWKPVFLSSCDRMGRFLDSASRTSELFHKKLIMIQADERLVLMIYIPNQIPAEKEVQVDASVRIFAVPRSTTHTSAPCYVTPTKANYRLYCDRTSFQLYQGERRNTFVFLTRGPTNNTAIGLTSGQGEHRRRKQQTIDEGVNFDCRASVALQKINESVRSHVGRMNRAGVLAAEIYVISNRDVASMRVLDQWLHYVDTQEVLPLFQSSHQEYRVPTLNDVDWSGHTPTVAKIVRHGDLSDVSNSMTTQELQDVLSLFNTTGQKVRLREFCVTLLATMPVDRVEEKLPLVQAMALCLLDAPYLVDTVLQSETYMMLKHRLKDDVDAVFPLLLEKLVLSVNSLGVFVKHPFRIVLCETEQMSIQAFSQLVELVALTVREPEFALDILLECLEPESTRLLDGPEVVVQQLVKSLTGIAMNHIDEAVDGGKLAKLSLNLTRNGMSDGYEVVKASIRIDAAEAQPKVGDHIRLVTSDAPQNAPAMQPATLDTLVIRSDQGSVSFRCLHALPPYVADCSWRYRHCGSFTTTKAMFDAVTRLYAEKSACCGIYRWLVGSTTKDERADRQEALTVPKAQCETLNNSQNEALSAAICHPLTFLWGPPGTGKTYTIVTIIHEMLRTFRDSRFLITAPTHNAVDNILRRLVAGHDAEVLSYKPLRVSTDVRKVSPDLMAYTCDAMVGKDLSEGFRGRREAQKRVKQSRLVFTTCAGAGLGLLRTEDFDVVLVDEASQQTEPETLIPLTKGCQRAILVGDHVQLRATVGRHAETTGFNVSLFERHYTGPDVPGVAKVMLDTQYRMHPDICSFSSNTFYDGKLQSAQAMSRIPLPTSQFPWPKSARKVFVQVESTEDIGRQSKSNIGQVQVCKRICTLLSTAPSRPASAGADSSRVEKTEQPKPDIAILTPYTAQRERLKEAIPGYTVSSIDGYQGREADIVVFCTVRSNAHYDIGFVNDLRRLNVAITRARAGLIIVGNRATLTTQAGEAIDSESKTVWKSLLDQCVELQLPG
ncbi:uncharacterized protein LTR77_004836 [Saxophila tyrrhenica]|uniref:RNA-directed RNA polymerase n=1 Tax=Saxophila tyrrhenica TaxID=1690608 RepID=A0AAV9PEE5_9PEZI|nr:hypothetical protein LTR77_004836 [Saxophila tyrrhenica]